MLSLAEIKNKMNFSEFSFIFFLLVPTISFGRCDDISFSICWMGQDNALERQNGNIRLNDKALKALSTAGKVTSLTVFPAVENKLTLQYGGSVQAWTFEITPRTKFTKISGRQKPMEEATNITKGFINLSYPEVFACESGTLFFHQDTDFFLALGHSTRLPVQLESRSPSMLLVSWVTDQPGVREGHTVTLYHSELGSFNVRSVDTTNSRHYRFTALEGCSPYLACVEIAGFKSFTCLAAITDPDPPRDFEVTSWNTSSISLSWDCPDNRKYSLFLLTAFHLNGTDHVTQEVALWQSQDDFVFTLSDLEPCSRLRFGLQTVCREGKGYRYSRMLLNDGNSVDSSIEALRQTRFGPDNYTLSWEVRTTSSISMFRVHHQEALQATTLLTSYTVGGLTPCGRYRATVEALCGDGVLMSSRTVPTHTGPGGVSELRYRSSDSTALWTSSVTHQADVAFFYHLSVEKGEDIQRGRLTHSQLPLPMLQEGQTYVLDVWEECDGQWESRHSHLCIERDNSSIEHFMRSNAHAVDLEMESSLTMVVPWSLPQDLDDDVSELSANMERILEDKLQELLKDFDLTVRIELVTLEPAEEPDKTKIVFMSFDTSDNEAYLPLPVEEQLDYIRSLNAANISVTDGVIYWHAPDLCASLQCPAHSVCINTLGSYTCLCQRGYYNVSSVIDTPPASQPLCNEKGLFSQCLDNVVSGGIAKPYLTSHMGGQVDVKLNDGRCSVDEDHMFYFFRTSQKDSKCGTEKLLNKTHIEFQNTLSVTLRAERTITRRHLKVIWKCVYPRHYVRNAPLSVGKERSGLHRTSSISVEEASSSLQLGLTMDLFTDASYTESYLEAPAMRPEDTVFLQVELHASHSFASDTLLRVESCWATESSDPEDTVRGVFLQDGCEVDDTFQWLSANGLGQRSRFSVQMFAMPQSLPLYFHCMTNICGHDEDCTKSCTEQQRSKRTVSQKNRKQKRAAVVSAGPLVVSKKDKSGIPPLNWTEHMTVIAIVAGSMGIVGITSLSLIASKAIISYYERLRLK